MKVAKLQQDSVPQPGAQQPQQGSSMAHMKVAKDAHCEYRKAGEQVQAAQQLLRMVSGQAPNNSLSPQAIAHLSQAKWVEAVKKAIGDYQTTERTLQRAVKVLKVCCFSVHSLVSCVERVLCIHVCEAFKSLSQNMNFTETCTVQNC